jgi:hypothetical protein
MYCDECDRPFPYETCPVCDEDFDEDDTME